MDKVQSIKVLIVEDDPGIVTLVKRKLQRSGFHVEVALDGTQGVAVYESGSFDLLVLDHSMPGLSGLRKYRAGCSPEGGY